MDGDTNSLICALREDQVDPLLLLYLTAPPRIIEGKPFLKSLLALHFKECMSPFVNRITSLLPPEIDMALHKKLTVYCSAHHLDFIKGHDSVLEAVFDTAEEHLLSTAASNWFECEGELKTELQKSHEGFKNFLPTVSKLLGDIRQISPSKFVAAFKKDKAREEYHKRKSSGGSTRPSSSRLMTLTNSWAWLKGARFSTSSALPPMASAAC